MRRDTLDRPGPEPPAAEGEPEPDPVEADGARTADRPWRRALATGASVWAAAGIAYFLINGMVWMMRSEAGPTLGKMLEVWDQWDAGHYVTIATQGYNPNTENPAFFPLYPLLIRYLEPVLPGGALSACLIVSHAACLGALIVMFRLIEDLAGQAMARRTVTYLMAFPFAFFMMMPYNESLFILLSVSAFYCMRQGLWVSAGLWCSLASATRQAGVLLALGFVIEYLRQRNWRFAAIRADILAVLFVPTGVLAFAWYCWRAFGDPLKFLHVQAAWGRAPHMPWYGTQKAIEEIGKASVDGAIFQPIVVLNVIDVASVFVTLVLLILAVVGPWRLGAESAFLTATSWVSFLVILISPIGLNVPLHSLPRYVLELIPAFMVIARMGANHHLERLYLMPAMATQGVLVLGWFFGFWLA